VHRGFPPIDVTRYYKFHDPEELLNKYFVVSFYQKYDVSRILANWWKEDKKLFNRLGGQYPTTGLWESYMYLMILLCRLYGEKDCSQFTEAWIPLAYTIAMQGKRFNWGAIISKQLSTKIKQAQNPKPGVVSSFHMTSYLFDVICTKNAFPDCPSVGKSQNLLFMFISTSYGRISIRGHTL
jgi:hypothetical protein